MGGCASSPKVTDESAIGIHKTRSSGSSSSSGSSGSSASSAKDPLYKSELEKKCKNMPLPNERELLAAVAEMKQKRETLGRAIERNKQMKIKIQEEMARAQDKITEYNDRIDKRLVAKKEYGKTLRATQEAHGRIQAQADSLLHALQRANMEISEYVPDEDVMYDKMEGEDPFHDLDPTPSKVRALLPDVKKMR